MKKFGITGVGGFVAEKHLKAIKDTNNELVAALDPHDSVGILDSYFPQAEFFTEFERFDRHLEKIRRRNKADGIDYLTVCSPNYLHDAHIRLALRIGADAICEKPIVLNPWNIDALQELERETGKKAYAILQLRVHPTLIELKKKIEKQQKKDKYKIVLSYITSRGNWYLNSWKGRLEQSGGLATNIGIHFFDLLLWLFGDVKNNEVHYNSNRKMFGFLELEKASVTWFLSIDYNDLPNWVKDRGQRTFRLLTMDGDKIDFSSGFTNLHTEVYKKILVGKGFGLDTAKPSIQLAHDIRVAEITPSNKNIHEFGKKIISGQ